MAFIRMVVTYDIVTMKAEVLDISYANMFEYLVKLVSVSYLSLRLKVLVGKATGFWMLSTGAFSVLAIYVYETKVLPQ